MFYTNRQIICSPIFAGGGLAVVLDYTFAQTCAAYQLEDMDAFVGSIWAGMGNGPAKSVPSGFLDMAQESLLVKGIYTGSDGVWLTLDTRSMCSTTERPFEYFGHNTDHAADKLWLLKAFQVWSERAMLLLEWS